MKITFVTSGSIKSNFTYRVLQLSRSLKKRGHEVSIICPSADKYNDFKHERITDIDGVKILQPFQFKTRRLEINLLPYILHALYIMFRQKSDLIYIYKPTPISIVGLVGKWLYRSEVVLDMDDLGSEVMKIEGHPYYQIKLVEWCEKAAAKYSDKIVTASTYLEQHYRNQFSTKPICVVSNAVDSDWFKPVTHTSEKYRIVFLGSINRQSILEPLFRVMPDVIKKIPETKLLVMGDGKFLSYFKKMSEDLGISNNVDFTGWLSLSQAQDKLFAGDIGYNYMPDEVTTKSASNMKVPQYMARGVVPIVSNIGDLPEYVGFGKYGYICEPDNTDSLRDGLISALNDKDRLSKSREGSLFSANRFSWDVLSEKFENWALNKKTSKEKNVYFVSITVPGNVGGSEIRNFHLMRPWWEMENTKVTGFYISSENPKSDSESMSSLKDSKNYLVKKSQRTIFRLIKSIFWDRLPPFMNDFQASGIGEEFRRVCEQNMPDVVHLEQIHAYHSIRKHIPWLKSRGVKILLDCHNIEFTAFDESLDIFGFSKKLVGKYLVSGMKKLELEAVSNADVVTCCSSLDEVFFKKLNQNTFIVPNGVDINYFKNDKHKHNHNIVFMGGVGYPPNEDALKWYLSEVHPMVKNHVPDVGLFAIGADQEWIEGLGVKDELVKALGFVPDVRKYLQESTIGICPIRYGSGTRLKILTYMASSLPVVSTYKGAEGVDYKNGQDIIMTDDPKDFALSVVRVLQDEAFARNMGQKGYDFVLKNYDWEVIGKGLRELYKTI